MRVDKRRRRENKTDYSRRIKILKSLKPRIIFRKTNKYIIAQYVVSDAAQDKVIINSNSKKLLNYGWPEKASGSLKSLPASYLTGYLIGKQIISSNLENPVVDTGMTRILHKSKVFAFLKGLIDSGIKMECKKEAFPDDKRLKGEHMKNKVPFDEILKKISSEKIKSKESLK